MKSLKKWFYRWLNPVQVGDVWHTYSSNPFSSTTWIYHIIAVDGNHVKFEQEIITEGISYKSVDSKHIFWILGPNSKLISEKQQ